MRDRPNRPGGPRARSRPGAPGRASRPATRRPAASGGAATRTSAPRPPGRITGRAVVLGVVLLALAVSYILPLRIYLSQQAEISQMRQSQAEQRAHIEDLEGEAARWADDDYIRIQARKRLHYVEPGEIPMITLWDEADDTGAERDAEEAPERSRPWWDTLLASVQTADDLADGPAGAADEEDLDQ